MLVSTGIDVQIRGVYREVGSRSPLGPVANCTKSTIELYSFQNYDKHVTEKINKL